MNQDMKNEITILRKNKTYGIQKLTKEFLKNSYKL